MSNVLIVGFGNIGYRHFESLVSYKKIDKIFLYDKNYNKLKNFKKKFKTNNKIVVLRSLNKNKKKFILSIISTNSNVRFSLFKKIVNNFNVKNFIFEKIVFQNSKEYNLANEIIKNNNLKCWINCPRRSWKIFKKLKRKIKKNQRLSIVVKGYNWGLLSNTIHFVDLFTFLTGKKDIKFYLNQLSEKIHKSKRVGFYETNGKILIKNSTGDKITLIDKKNKKKNELPFNLIQNKFNFYFNQNDPNNRFKPPFQSRETIKHFKNILNNKKCNLPLFVSTYEFHKLYSEVIGDFIKKISKKNNYFFT